MYRAIFLYKREIALSFVTFIFLITAVRLFKLPHLLHDTRFHAVVDLNENALQCSSVLYVFGHFIVGRSMSKPPQHSCWELGSYISVSASSAWQNKLLVPSMELCRKCVFGRVSILHINRLFNFRSRGGKCSLPRRRAENWKIPRGEWKACEIQRYRRARRVFYP